MAGVPTNQNDGLGAFKQAKKGKILWAGNSKWTIANAMSELGSVNRTLVDLQNIKNAD